MPLNQAFAMRTSARWRLAGLLLLSLAALPAAPAHADDKPDDQAARNHFDRGAALYQQEQFEEAMREFSTAYELRPLPALLFNIGRCHERLEHWAEAADAFTRYLDVAADLNPAERAELQARIAVLRGRVERARTSVAAAAPSPAPPGPLVDHGRARLRLGAGLVAGAAAAAAIAGTTLVLTVGPDYKRLETTCRLRPCGAADTAGLRARLDAGYALWAVAGAAAVTDVVLWVIAARRPSLRAMLAPGAGGFVLGSER
jgi:tetratricopeptide (TPR) repeat protein